ncbi:MAG: ATP-binding protein [Ilumatobacteraceae bacterium]
MTLRFRLIAIVTLIVVAGVASASVVAYVATSQRLNGEIERFLVGRAAEVVQGQREAPQARPNGRPNPASLPFEPDAVAQMINEDGRITGSSGVDLPIAAGELAVASGDASATERTVTIDGVEYRMRTSSLPRGGAIQVARTLTEVHDVLRAPEEPAPPGRRAASGDRCGRRHHARSPAMRPLERLAGAAERAASTQDLSPIGATGHGGRSGQRRSGTPRRLFDRMLAACAPAAITTSARPGRWARTADAAHEPAGERGVAPASGSLAGHRPAGDPGQPVLGGQRVGGVVRRVLELATDAEGRRTPDEPLDLADLVASAVERFRRRTGRIGDARDRDSLVGNAALLERAITNLLGNAHKFSLPSTVIEVTLDHRWVMVSDRGPGIPEADLARVFDRFYRSDTTRTSPGSGLGLSIVAQIAERHGGTVAATNRSGGGATVGFSVGG